MRLTRERECVKPETGKEKMSMPNRTITNGMKECPIKPNSGFTLIELLVVISIIALMLSILLPSLQKAKESGKTVVCVSNMKQQAMASEMYTLNNDNALIPERSYSKPINQAGDLDTLIWAALLAPYIQSTKGSSSPSEGGYWAEDRELEKTVGVFKCPAQTDQFQFTWYLRYGINLNHVSNLFLPSGPRILKITSITQPAARLHIADSMDNVPKYEKLSTFTQRLRDNIKSAFGYGYPGMSIWPTEDGRGLGSYVLLVGDRHTDGANALFLDGHITYYKYSDIMFKSGEPGEKRAPKVAMWHYKQPPDYYNW